MSDTSDPVEYFKYYHFQPSLAAACIFAVLFGISTLWHGVLIWKHRTWYFIPVIIGGLFELVGYAARGASSKQDPTAYTLGPFVIQTLLLLVAPPLFAASIYMILGRIILTTNAEIHSPIRQRWLTKIFVTSDVICFFLQLAGAGLMSSTSAGTSNTGSHIVLAGLLIQIILFGGFLSVAVIFHRRLLAAPTNQSKNPSLHWRKFLLILYIAGGLILIRCIVRVAEFVEGFSGFIMLHEVFLYIFDAVPMAGVVYLFNIWYPAKFSKRPRKDIIERESGRMDTQVDSDLER